MSTLLSRWRWARIGGLILASIPLAILLLFAVGETTGGDLSGLQHLPQALPLAFLVWVAWRWPKIGGPALAAVSAALGVGFLVAMSGRLSPGTGLGTALVFFAPPLLAGLLFWVDWRHLAGRHEASAA